MKLKMRNKAILIIDYYKKDENGKYIYDGQTVDRITRKDLEESFNADLEKGIKHQFARISNGNFLYTQKYLRQVWLRLCQSNEEFYRLGRIKYYI